VISQADPGFSIVPGDPTLLAGSILRFVAANTIIPAQNETFELQVVAAGSSGTDLSWTYPPTLVTYFAGPQGDGVNLSFRGLSLQSSPNSISTPNPAHVVYLLGSTGTDAPPAPTAGGWTTIMSWGPSFFATLPTTFHDSAVPNPVLSYRLVLFMLYTFIA
jgi:hypothetical protein